ncbi:uncharacterized protein LOC127131570 [Lathyrus oleraceus]|uniref:uncharacterized protein LOC127131570 n=1 Tax=Pisum sativum TaxID=3888 RepID=UPI0021CE62B6|nr:uncharacterized protein LOC127131570 [Pisum sativum]
MQILVQEDDQYQDYYFNAEENITDEKFRMLEERLRVMENENVMGMDFNDMGLIPGLRIPKKFKVPEFIKYKANSCPKTHVCAYFRKISAYSNDEKMLMHFFQDSLSGGSLDWYMSLERANVRSWRELVNAFVTHYHYNSDMAPNRTQLQNLTQGNNESFKEYAQRWRKLVARVQPALMERELVDLFMGTLQGVYYDRLVGCTTVGFPDLVTAGEHVEVGIKLGKIQVPSSGSSSDNGEKPFTGFSKKKEDSSSACMGKGKGRAFSEQVAIVTILIVAPRQQTQQLRQQQQTAPC